MLGTLVYSMYILIFSVEENVIKFPRDLFLSVFFIIYFHTFIVPACFSCQVFSPL